MRRLDRGRSTPSDQGMSGADIRIPAPRMAQRTGSGGPRRFPYVRTVIGGLAFLGLVFALVEAVAANLDNNAYASAPICRAGQAGAGQAGSACVALVPATVNFASVDRTAQIPVASIDLGSTTPGIGEVTLDANIAFAEALRTNDQVQVQLWHGKVVAVVANNETVPTTDAPSLENTAAVLTAIVCELVAFVMLRSASRARLATMLRRELKRGPGNRQIRLFGFTVAVIGIAGTYGISVGYLWGAIAIAVAFLAIAYSVAVPYLWPGNIRRW